MCEKLADFIKSYYFQNKTNITEFISYQEREKSVQSKIGVSVRIIHDLHCVINTTFPHNINMK